MPYFSQDMADAALEILKQADGLLLGRRTYARSSRCSS
jgi:hypothetical protein